MTISPSNEIASTTEGKHAAQKRYRYFEEAPERIAISASELLRQLPAEYCHPIEGATHPERQLDLPCQELFRGNTPRISLSSLQGLAPDLIRIPEGTDGALRLSLPAGWLALHYHLISRREELPPEPGSIPEPEEQSRKESIELLMPVEAASLDLQTEEKTKDSTAPAEKTDQATKPFEALPEQPADKLATIEKEPEPVEKEKKRGFFASLPIFRCHHQEAEPSVEPAVVASREFVRQLKPMPRSIEPSPSTHAVNPSEEPSSKDLSIKLERLWKLDPTDQLADAAALQALFMTEEKLTLERVMGLAGQLPGLKACVLAHGDQVVCASNMPAGIDQRALSSQAMTMLTQIRDSSVKMGLGAVPAITLHAEEGILSFLYQGELCLLVLHADRGFVPGVRERLQEMLAHLTSAQALPGGASAQPSLPI